MQFFIEKETVEADVIFRKRRTLCIQIRPPGQLTIISPLGKSESEIRQAVQLKSKWVAKKLSEMKRYESFNKDRQFIDGEIFYYKGDEYTLQIVVNERYKRLQVHMKDSKLQVYTASTDSENIQYAIERWYKKHALDVILERVTHYQQYFSAQPAQIVVKKQKKRWGSCTAKHKLLFNFKCIMLPLCILDYIIVHEMCHMVHFNHSKEFWLHVERILPDYKQRKEWLKHKGGTVI